MYQRPLDLIWETEISYFNVMLCMTCGCWRGYKAHLIIIHFRSHLFITLELGCVLKPDSCWAAMRLCIIFFTLYEFNCINPSLYFFLIFDIWLFPTIAEDTLQPLGLSTSPNQTQLQATQYFMHVFWQDVGKIMDTKMLNALAVW